MKKQIFFYLIFIITNLKSIAQNNLKQGMVLYREVIVVDTIGNNESERKGILYFNTDSLHSLYKWRLSSPSIVKNDDGSLTTAFKKDSNQIKKISESGIQIYKNYLNNVSVLKLTLAGEWYIVSDTYDIKWELLDETKMFKGMQVQKAVTNFRGRSYTAWFNPAIPIPDGPWKYRGLPGLIVEIYDEKKHIRIEMEAMQIPASFNVTIKVPKKGIPIIYPLYAKQYQEIMNIEAKMYEAQFKQMGGDGVILRNEIER